MGDAALRAAGRSRGAAGMDLAVPKRESPSAPFGSSAIVGPSWRQPNGVAEEARTRGFATPALAGCAIVEERCQDRTRYGGCQQLRRPVALLARRTRLEGLREPQCHCAGRESPSSIGARYSLDDLEV